MNLLVHPNTDGLKLRKIVWFNIEPFLIGFNILNVNLDDVVWITESNYRNDEILWNLKHPPSHGNSQRICYQIHLILLATITVSIHTNVAVRPHQLLIYSLPPPSYTSVGWGCPWSIWWTAFVRSSISRGSWPTTTQMDWTLVDSNSLTGKMLWMLHTRPLIPFSFLVRSFFCSGDMS